jgi:hypothetical protein
MPNVRLEEDAPNHQEQPNQNYENRKNRSVCYIIYINQEGPLQCVE